MHATRHDNNNSKLACSLAFFPSLEAMAAAMGRASPKLTLPLDESQVRVYSQTAAGHESAVVAIVAAAEVVVAVVVIAVVVIAIIGRRSARAKADH